MRFKYLTLFCLLVAGCNENLTTPDGKSNDLARDLNWMWETTALKGSHDPSHPPDPYASSERAIRAAGHVFATVNLVGKTREEVLQIIGNPKDKSDSIYNFPFYPAAQDALVFRFDNGAWGTQYNIEFVDGKVTKVESIGIE